MEQRKQWIECQVFPGMFSNERTVEVGSRSFFVEEGSLRNVKDEAGEVEVTIIEIEGKEWAVMPTSTRESFPLPA